MTPLLIWTGIELVILAVVLVLMRYDSTEEPTKES